MNKITLILLFVCCAPFFLSSCGVKPNSLEIPPGANEEFYPKQYPSK